MTSLGETDVARIAAHVRDHLASLDDEFESGFIFADEIASAKGISRISTTALSAAAKDLGTASFYLIVRGPDDFSAQPYIWVSARPSKWLKSTPPETCWVVRSPDGRSSLRIAEGLLVFSRMGYANGHATSLGMGDFNLESRTWGEIARAPGRSYEAAVIDFADGEEKVILPFS